MEKIEQNKPKSNDPGCNRFDGLREGDSVANKNMRHVGGLLSELPNALHNDSDSVRLVSQEKAIHRRFTDLQLQGYTPTEIAKLTGYSMQWVSQVLKQPFARQYFITESKKSVQDEIKEFLEAEVIPSLKFVKEVRDDVTARKSDRLSATNTILDRFLGKPTQPISTNVKPPSEMSDQELREQIEREITATKPN